MEDAILGQPVDVGGIHFDAIAPNVGHVLAAGLDQLLTVSSNGAKAVFVGVDDQQVGFGLAAASARLSAPRATQPKALDFRKDRRWYYELQVGGEWRIFGVTEKQCIDGGSLRIYTIVFAYARC